MRHPASEFSDGERRSATDRRKKRFDLFNRYRLVGGRRQGFRRGGGKDKYGLVDIYGFRLWTALLLIILLSLSDAYLTGRLIEMGVVREANPLMAFYLDHGIRYFIVMKYLFTAAPLFFVCLFKNLLLTRISVVVILVVYLSIVSYELSIMYEVYMLS